MSWTDKKSIEQFVKLRDEFDIKVFVETGTFRGINTIVHAHNFKNVFTCELVKEYYDKTKELFCKYDNIHAYLETSPDFLTKMRPFLKCANKYSLIYLDAHFYDPNLPKEDRWVVLKELAALKNIHNCIIVIHDFDNKELGHLVYDGVHLDFDLLKDALYKVNPKFLYYTNSKNTCDPVTKERIKNGEYEGVVFDADMEDTLDFVWSNETKTYRGLLYCVPEELDLSKFDLRKLEV